MSLLEHPEAQAILADAVLTPEAVRGCEDRLARLPRTLPAPLPTRRAAATTPRSSSAACSAACSARPASRSRWRPASTASPSSSSSAPASGTTRRSWPRSARHVAEELGDDRAVLVLDASTFPKSGADSCGVGRQWCGRLGKQENCQRGIFLAYAAAGGYAPLDRQLYLPKDWADDPARREKCHVPEGVEFREGWRIAAELIERSGPGLPHGWVVGDDEFGRPAQFRAWLRRRGERYILDVPGDTVVRDLECRRPERRAGRGARPQVPFGRVDAWAARQPEGRWTRLTDPRRRAGAAQRVDAMAVRVRTKLDRRNGPEERLVVMRTVEAKPETHYALSNAGPEVALEELVRVRFTQAPDRGGVRGGQAAKTGWPNTRSGAGWGGTTT